MSARMHRPGTWILLALVLAASGRAGAAADVGLACQDHDRSVLPASSDVVRWREARVWGLRARCPPVSILSPVAVQRSTHAAEPPAALSETLAQWERELTRTSSSVRLRIIHEQGRGLQGTTDSRPGAGGRP